MAGRTLCMKGVSDDAGDVASLSDVVGQGGPAEIEKAKTRSELVIDLLRQGDENVVRCVKRHGLWSDRRRGKRAGRGTRG